MTDKKKRRLIIMCIYLTLITLYAKSDSKKKMFKLRLRIKDFDTLDPLLFYLSIAKLQECEV